jgi:hypothetical protein
VLPPTGREAPKEQPPREEPKVREQPSVKETPQVHERPATPPAADRARSEEKKDGKRPDGQ